jgi:hypothetical protein
MKGEKGMYCFDHKIDSMVDVKHKTCSIEICTTRPSYGYPGSSPSFCSSHHPEGTISKSLKKCIFNEDGDCKEYATHGPDRKTLLRCEEHALPEDISLVERKCVQCSRIDVLNKNNICVNFCSLEEADRVFKKLIKHKEESIGRLLTSEINHNLYSSDKIIDTSCTKRRPDFVYHFGTHVLIVEVDENQHNGYLCTAYGDGKEGKLKGESIRMYQIGQCFDGLPILFLRYNPDTYKSPHKVNQKERQQTLVRWVKYCMEYKEWMLGFKVKYLFYDSYEPSDTEWKDVEPVL